MIEAVVEKYSRVVAEHPLAFLGLLIVFVGLMASGASSVETVEQNNEDLLPDTIESVNAFDIIGSEFGQRGGGSTYTVLLETSPNHVNSTEIRDVRSPELLRYIETVSSDVESMNEVVSVDSAADLVDSPSTKREAWSQMKSSGQASQYVSDDYSFTIMRVSSTSISSGEAEELAGRIKESVERNDKPASIEAGYTGDPFINQAFQEQSQSTQGQTTLISLVGVLVLVVVLFRSVANGLTSLSALIFGIMSGFGVYGLLGLNLSPATSGAISMGMGIAIDFGIQSVSRYREEREDLSVQGSVQNMILGIINPMTIALVAAVIGFTALSFGRITFLSDLGTMLTLTTLFAYIGALTLIPVLLVIYDKYIQQYFSRGVFQIILGESQQ
ncbi:MMPL family transporter [Candidatus Nanohalobium constans]|uniref:Putative exporter of the RND superfamily n=1 Tax=Candidatus Nanohalobium constans TaxID=2565781 RepID=A0A5Q0UH89_9ARCH|nr:MMPL family transporter [Candidatus Nanohalobium constans]QGA80954.1 putative exporter of the RND superfamily [Candidatus Nanohalobium constans]